MNPLRTSRSISKIAPAFVAAQGSFPAVLRVRENAAHDSKFSSLADLIKATRRHLKKNGLAIMQAPTKLDKDRETITISTRLQHKSGQYFESEFEMPIFEEEWSKDNLNAQVIGSAVSYACRYAYKAMLGIANPDDDGNAASRIPADYRRVSGKKPGTHPKIVKGELIEVRDGQDAHTHYARCVGCPSKLWITQDDIRFQLDKSRGELVEIECRVSDYADFWEVVRILKIGPYDFTNGNDLTSQVQAGVAAVMVKHNLEKASIPEPF